MDAPNNETVIIPSGDDIARLVDHTQLKPTAGTTEIVKLCSEAKELGFYSVCVHPAWVRTARKQLEGSNVKICAVAGFPLGANRSTIKMSEATLAVDDGAHEIDMVINIAAFLDGEYNTVHSEIATVVSASWNVPIKVIIETCYLSDEQIVKAAEICCKEGAAFVKTSTGFGSRGASLKDIELIKQGIENAGATGKVRIKASGGIRDHKTALTYIQAGVHRLGASAGRALLAGHEHDHQAEGDY